MPEEKKHAYTDGVMKTLFCFLILISNVALASASLEKKLAEGDLIFIHSQTEQAAAISESTGSNWTHVGVVVKKNGDWFVAEAVGPLQVNSIRSFIARSKDNKYKVMRFKYFSQKMVPQLYSQLYKYNQPYDIFFEWSDERIYCSELTYKVFMAVTGHPIGQLQKVGDLKLNGPYTKKLIEERLTAIGKELNLEEPIITPVAQTIDPNMALVDEQ